MPLPFGHSLMGYTLYEVTPNKAKIPSWAMILLFVLVANLPDIDFLPGFIDGDPNKYHHGLTHSIAFSIAVGLVFGWLFRAIGRRFFIYALIFGGVCFSHVVLDFFTADTSPPYGMPLFWPVQETYYISPVTLFLSVHKSGNSETFIQSLFVMHNLWVALWEMVLFLPIIVVIKWLKKSRGWRLSFDRA